MGYNITIGELEISKEPDDGLDCPCLYFHAKGTRRDDAPAFGEPTDYTNQRWPGYDSWSDVLSHADMYDLFFEDGRLIGGHPGVRLVTPELVTVVGVRKADFERRYPHVVATYGDPPSHMEEDPSNPPENETYCRVVWLDYWLRWALENCETPVIANT